MPNDVLTIDSGPVQGRIHKQTGRIEVVGPNRAAMPLSGGVSFFPATAVVAGQARTIGRVISSASIPDGLEIVQEFGTGQVRTRLSFPFAAVMRYEVLDWGGQTPDQTAVSAASGVEEHFYGFGEKFNALDQTGHLVEMVVFDNPGNKGDHSYKVAPWFISTRGYGFHLDSTAHSTFDMRTAATGRFTVTNRIGTLKFNVVYGPLLTDVLSRYTGFTGRPTLPPQWAFGPWISSDVWRDGGEVRYAVEKFRQRKIPVSAFVFDSPWEIAYNDFRFNIGDPVQTQFGHPGTFEGQPHDGFKTVPDLMVFLQQKGLKVVCWMTPFINVSSKDEGIRGQNLGPALPDGVEDRFFVRDSTTGNALVVPWWKGQGRPIDFTSQAARDWLSNRLRDLLAAAQVDTASGHESAIGAFKTDDGESGNGTNTYIPDRALYSDGRTGREMVNGYCLEYHKTVAAVLGDQGLLFARSGFSGTQAFPGCWAGDNEPNFGDQNGLPSVIVAGLSAAMSGFSIWGHDVGGYLNANFSSVSTADLFIRWTQFGCFSPLMQMHRQVDGGNLRQYPWGYAEAGETIDQNRALDNYRFYATLHTRLFPYLYTYAQTSRDTGLPILRPLVLIHPDDPQTFGLRHVYYFGGELLVAPIVQPNVTQRQVYLPEGVWFDYWTNERHVGRQTITWTNPAQPAVPQSKIPVFVRQGAIVPFILGDDVQTLCDADYVNHSGIVTWNGGLDIRVHPDGRSHAKLFDGTDIECDAGPASNQLAIVSPTSRPIALRILAPRPVKVERDGTSLPEIPDPAAFAAATSGWQFDQAAGFVVIKFLHAGGMSRIVVGQ
jgi:alpha-D-xyloside xylohydrolase